MKTVGHELRIVLTVLSCLTVTSGQASYADRLYGLARMERLDQLPYLLEGTQVRQVSSHDRSGGNDDGFEGTYSSLYIDDQGEHVLFDEIGAGCLYRFWMTYGDSEEGYADLRLRFYFDHEVTPRLDISIDEFFDGVGAPLEYPLVGRWFQSSHGCYCYLPFPYRQRLKITLSGTPLFYSMTYHRYASPDGVVSWTGHEDSTAVMTQWSNAGQDPKSSVSNLVVQGDMPLGALATGTLFLVTGEGAVQSIRLDPSPASTSILSQVWLEMNWDGDAPEVEVPLGDFFGSGGAEINVTALPIGMSTTGDYYCYFPMPYWTSAEIRIVNRGDTALASLPFEVGYTTNAYHQAEAGYFHALYQERSFVSDADDFIFIEASGRGHVVGVSAYLHGSATNGYRGMGYLEGDERVYVDDGLSPCLYGTGTEDYFNAGWYFNQGRFSLPYHGCPYARHYDPPNNYTQAYRFHLSDIIPFTRAISFGMEHGRANNQPGTYWGTTYYYKRSGPEPGWVPTVDLNVGDAWSEEVHAYAPTGTTIMATNTWSYEGVSDTLEIPDTGHSCTGGTIGFSLPLVANAGVILRRRSDQGVGGQRAEVYIDGVLAGTWYDADHNFAPLTQRWLDSEFMIPGPLVAGKTSAQVTLVVSPSSPPWTGYRYRAYCVKPLVTVEDVDVDGLPDAWELTYCTTRNVLSREGDRDLDGSSDLSEYIAGTDPTNAASRFRMLPGRDATFASRIGRLYTVQQCTDLAAGTWESLRTDVPGTGYTMSAPTDTTAPLAYFRLQVEKP